MGAATLIYRSALPIGGKKLLVEHADGPNDILRGEWMGNQMGCASRMPKHPILALMNHLVIDYILLKLYIPTFRIVTAAQLHALIQKTIMNFIWSLQTSHLALHVGDQESLS